MVNGNPDNGGGNKGEGGDSSHLPIPEGYRVVQEGEAIPAGYTTRVHLQSGKKITNAPPPSSTTTPPVQPAPVQPPPPFTNSPEPKVLEKMVDVKEKPQEKPTTFSFLDNQRIEKEIAKPTNGDEAKKAGSSAQELADKLKNSGSASSSPSSPSSTSASTAPKEPIDESDFAENADFLIDGVAFGLSSLFRWWSLDTTETPYEFKQAKIDKLKNQLARILKKKQKAFPLEWACVGTLLAMCITPATKAFENRKVVLAERAIAEAEKQAQQESTGGAGGNGTGSPRGSSRRGRGQPPK